MLALHARAALAAPRGLLATWPSANIKFAFIEKLLASAAAAGAAPPTPCARVWRCSTWRSAPRRAASPGTRRSSRRCSSRASTARLPGRRTRRSPTRSRAPWPRCRPRTRRPALRGVPPPETKLLQHRLDELCAKHVAAAVAGAAGPATPQRADPGHERGVRADVHLRARGAPAARGGPLPSPPRQAAVRLTHELNQASAAGRRASAACAAARRRASDAARARVRLRRARHVAMRVSDRFARDPRRGEHKQLFRRHAPAAHQRPQARTAPAWRRWTRVEGWATTPSPAPRRAPSATPRRSPRASPRRPSAEDGDAAQAAVGPGEAAGDARGGGREGRGHGRGDGGG